MIDRLRYIPDVDSVGNCYGKIPPSKDEIIDKINEIIDYLNKLEDGKDNKRFSK